MIIENSLARADIDPQGAQVLSYTPRGGRDLLWLSPNTKREAGVPVRGGIPLCAPWFSNRYPGKPSHGFCRIRTWHSDAPETLKSGSTRVLFWLEDDEATRALWPTSFRFEHEVTVGTNLGLVFRAWNRGTEPVLFEAVWHTYFSTIDAYKSKVTGLEGRTYLDKNQDRAEKVQTGALFPSGAMDWIFPSVPKEQTVEQGALRVKVRSDAPSAVVWNVGDGDAKVADLGPGAHKQYLCVERGALDTTAVTLEPGEPYELAMTLTPY